MRLALGDVSVRLAGREVVRGVSAAFERGGLVALVGPNGAGKTSLLRAITGVLPHGGRIALGGAPLDRLPPTERARRIGYLPQGHVAHWPLAARDIVALGRAPHGSPDPARLRPDDQAAVERAMRLTGVAELADRPVTELSGGERARVALARVLSTEAEIVLADEPTTALDPRFQLEIVCALRTAADAGALIIAVTHDLALAARFAERVLVIDGGRIAADGAPAEALSDEVLARVFGIAALRASRDGEAALLPWAAL
jgi:iron complex transport system ATP-binding protein